MNLLEKYAKEFDLHSISVGIFPSRLKTVHAYTAYVHWKDPNSPGTSNQCSSGWGPSMKEAILKAIEEKK